MNAQDAGRQVIGWIEQPTPIERIVADVAQWDDDALESLQVSLVMALGDPAFDPPEQRDIEVMIWAIGNEYATRRGDDPAPRPDELKGRS